MDWRKNLYHYEEQPPAHIWNKVSEELAADAPASLREGLYGFSQEPPAAVWEKLSQDLEGEEKPIQIGRTVGSWKLAVAAAAAALVFGIFYFNRDAGTPKVSASVIQPVQPAPAKPGPATPATNPEPAAAIPQPAEGTAMSSAPEKIATVHTASVRRTAADHNYIYFTTASGERRRLSYKLEKFLPAIRNNRKNEMVEEWTSALERSSFVPSGSNFFDIVEMVRMVEEKQQ